MAYGLICLEKFSENYNFRYTRENSWVWAGKEFRHCFGWVFRIFDGAAIDLVKNWIHVEVHLEKGLVMTAR